ncbi:T9SS type A sorting domain-containing protein [Maribacter algarum]|uniref:T9SS type A sorting domain-containing protein n=1 Tax=Maribacter algarum (ex Zhang et al. 2020) TaxID=2578118 RepID=A0A5S3PW69_9FLAO|nr:zinc-dependent metalloprotease family protein [Maribacter algarum]TMM58452.1 T9SS type A sorting domain-containing protein [Maribacter algarum]
MITKLRLVFSITIAFLSFYGSAQTGYWQQDVTKGVLDQSFSDRFNVQKGQIFSFDEQMFRKELKDVSVSKGTAKIVYFPNENGEFIAFRVSEQPVLSPELSKKYPSIKSYAGHTLNEAKDKIRFSVSHNGVQSMIVHSDKRGSTFMQKDANGKYVIYDRDSNPSLTDELWCSTEAKLSKTSNLSTFKQPVTGQSLRKFRLAVSASGEYTEYHGGTVADALAAINATVTRVNEVYETDLAIRFELVANTDQVIFTDAEEDPYSGSLSSKVQNELTTTIGEANYDLGILFHKIDNGVDGNSGFLGAVCVDNRKGSAYGATPDPIGDLFDLDIIAHEIGHQFSARHTWSFQDEDSLSQIEPGSGTTIMGYAGITGINNVALNGDDYFHYISIVEITDYLGSISCGETISLTNSPPVVTPTGAFTIPISTPFVLSGDATDTDTSDILTYTWEQIDDGEVPQSAFGPNNQEGSNFRSVKPSTNPERYFPRLTRVLSGQLTETNPTIDSEWETVSNIERELNFALTVRDNALGGGQVASDLVNVFVDNSAGPFIVTSQSSNIELSTGDTEEITWDVANTEKAPINAQTVDIFLSTDGGATFPTLLAEDVPNDGSHIVQIPASPAAAARIMVKAHDNIFFAVNSSNFIITESEIIMNFAELEPEVCASDILVVPFTYETFLGFNEEATFSIATPPSGVDITIFPETAVANGTPVEVTFTNTQNLAIGAYPIRVLASTASSTKEVTFNLNVYDANFSDVLLTAPDDDEIDVSTTMLFEWQVDDLATSYDIEIARDEAFTDIIETGSVISNSFTPSNLENFTEYYWRVKSKNSCGEGVFGAPFSFITIPFSCEVKDASDLPAIISAAGTPKVFSSISVFDDLPIADINVRLELDHSFLEDLVVTLTSPSGTTVVLINNSCDDSRNVNATFDDSATGFICQENPAISGTVKPLGALSSFNGQSTLGEWILTVSDNAPSDGGVLKEFSLEICAEGEFRPDADNDGVFDDGPDLCLDTPAGTQVDTSGCPILVVSPSNYRIEARSESCRSSNDGSIVVNAQSALDYTAVLTGNGTNSSNDFTTPSLTLNNLAAGTYNLCITATDGTLVSSEQCFDVVIEEPQILSVSSTASLDGSFVDLEMEGASIYNIDLNGVVRQVEGSEVSLDLKAGLNTLKVTTNLPCQGTYEEKFLFSDEPFVYPNPFGDFIKVFFGTTVDEVKVRIFAANGRLVLDSEYAVNSTEQELDLTALSTGLYFIQFEADNIKGTSKVIKR